MNHSFVEQLPRKNSHQLNLWQPDRDQSRTIRPERYSKIPEELKRLDQWVLFRNEIGNNGRIQKPPYQPSGARASTADRSTWSSFNQVAIVANKFEGIGFVFADDDPYIGIDLDKCRDRESGDLEPWAEKVVRDLTSYTEVSPSGTGVHVIVRSSRSDFEGHRRGQFEIYRTKRYFTVTGDRFGLDDYGIEDRTKEVTKLLTERNAAKKNRTHPVTDNSSVNESNTKVRSDVTLPIAVQDAIDSEPALQGLWGMETPLAGQQDETASGYGYFLICQLSLRKHNRQACVDTLVVFRQMHQAVHRDAAWFLREVDRAFAWVESNQAKKTFGSTEGILRIAFDHWRSHVQLNSPLLTIDWVLFTSMACNSYDGEHARISNQSLADMAGCSSRYISKRLSRIVELGCLIEVEKSTRVSPRKFRMNFAHSIANGMNTSSNHSVLLGDV